MGVGSEKGSDNGVVDEPVDSSGSPLNGVLVVAGQRSGDGVVGTTVVGAGVTLAEVVGLDLGVVTTDPLPINLVEIIGLKDGAGHDTLALGGLDDDIDTTEEEVVVGADGGGVALLLNNEVGTLGVVGQ